MWISICNYQKNLLLEQQYLFGQQKPLWTTEPTTSNTKLEEQPIEEINEYILTFTAFNLEIDWLLILLLYKRIVLTLISMFFVRSISWNYVWQMLLFSKNILDILIQFKMENITSLFTNLNAWNSCPNLMTLSKDRSIYYSNTKIPWWNHHQ